MAFKKVEIHVYINLSFFQDFSLFPIIDSTSAHFLGLVVFELPPEPIFSPF